MSETDRLKRAVDGYTNTIERLEPELHMIDTGAGIASIAISLKRIADALENLSENSDIVASLLAGVQPLEKK